MAKLYMIEDNKTGKTLNGYADRGEPRFVRMDHERRIVVYPNKGEASKELETLIYNGYDVKIITLTY